jgi:CheY-like chemotaxis protein
MMMEQLVEAKDKAEKNDKLKTAFINNISHEIRTPLNGILGFGQLLADPDLSAEERKEMFDCVQKSSDRLLNTISDYMDMAMIVSGTVDVQKRAFSLGSLFDGLSAEANQLCAEKKIGFRTAVPSDLADMELISDLELLKKILRKLIDNAIKFTREGGIICGCSLKGPYIEFFVKDTGCGIDGSKLELMFQSFNQSETSYNRGYEGSGLGLPIARGLTTLLGGEIWGTSEKGTGSEFFFKIPANTSCSPASSVKRGATRGKSPGNSLILIAEDDDLAFRYLEKLLLPTGSAILHASDGKEAVDYCRDNPDISMVLMDIKMPLMDGLEATQEIRKFRPALPIIATTAYAQTGDEQSFLASGCDGYIAKPFNREKLFALIESQDPRGAR